MHGSSHGSGRLVTTNLAYRHTSRLASGFFIHPFPSKTRGFTVRVTRLLTLPLRKFLAEPLGALGPRFGASLQNHASDRGARGGAAPRRAPAGSSAAAPQ